MIDAYVHAGNKQALEVARKFADWAKKGTDNLDDERFQKMLRCECGGMNDSLAHLSLLTGNKDFLALARRFDHKVIIDEIQRTPQLLSQIQVAVDKDRVRVALHSRVELPPPGKPRLCLVHAVSRGARHEWVLQKATELGVDQLLPAICERSVTRPGGGNKSRRWHEIVRQAARQCERGTLPELADPMPFEQVLPRPEVQSADLRLIATPGAGPLSEQTELLQRSAERVVLAVGPEGGFCSSELTMASDEGFVPVGLGSRVLRSETAALALLAVAAHLCGRLDR